MDKNSCVPRYSVANLSRGFNLATSVQAAGSSKTRRKGLLGVDRLVPGSGIWILPCEAIHTFGMKIPIDVIFLDRDFCVRKLVPSLPARRIRICLKAYSVLELQPGAIHQSATQVGDYLQFKLLTL